MESKASNTLKLAVEISDLLRKNGVETVLCGGGCVTIYTEEKYISGDLDFVNSYEISYQRIESILSQIGFKKTGRIFIKHDAPLSIDFVNPPLTVGFEHIQITNEIELEGKILKLLTPTDSVKDRLAAYFYWNSKPSMEQAILVCKNQKIDFKNIQEWIKKEGIDESKYDFFLDKLKIETTRKRGLSR